MKLFANLIFLSLMISMASFSEGTTSLVDPTHPPYLVEKDEESVAQDSSEQSDGKENQETSVSIPDYRLYAIKIGRSSRMAIINGEAMFLGQKIGPAKLLKINSDSVVMNVNGKTITVSLLPDSIKTRSPR